MTTQALETPETPPSRWRSALLLLATAAAAAAGPGIVVWDRWLGRPTSGRFLTFYADRFPFLKSVNLPTYTAVIAVGFVLLIALGFPRAAATLTAWRRRCAFAREPRRPSASKAQRTAGTALAAAGGAGCGLLFLRQAVTRHIPGPELAVALCAFGLGMVLREVSTTALGRRLRQNGGNLLSIVAAHVAVIFALASYYSFHRFQLPLSALAVVAVGNLATRVRRTGPIPLIVLAFVCIYTWRVNAWWFALVGDEYRNWDLAEGILTQQNPAFVASHLFQLDGGLEGLDPYVCSLIQAASMRILGVNSFGWRFSGPYLAAIALAFFFRFFRTFLKRRAALATTVCLGASHYIIGFGKIGYDKFQAYLAMALLLAAAGWAIRTRRMVAFVGMGFAAGLCFWVYPAALYILPLPAFLLVLYAPPRDGKTLARWAFAGLTAAFVLFPLPFQPTYFEGKRPGTVWYNPELVHSTTRLIDHFISNFIYMVFSPIVLGIEDHFVTSSYLDPLTGALFLVGLASSVWLVRRDRFVAFLVISLGFLTLLAGTTHDREYPPTTRMFLVLPVFLPLASAGLWRLLVLARSAGVSKAAAVRAVCVIVAAVVALNVVQAHVITKRRSDGYQVLDSLVVRLAQKIATLPAGQRPGLMLVIDDEGPRADIPMVLHVYALDEVAEHYTLITAGADGLGPAEIARAADGRFAVIPSPFLSPALRDRVERQLATTGKRPCSIQTTSGYERFKLWSAPGAPDLCRE